MATIPCPDCTGNISASQDRCPHCGRPGLFPNVRAAEQADEQAALNRRYLAAVADAQARGCAHVVQQFEAAAAIAQAVIARPLGDVDRLASSEKQGYATYYQLTESEVRLPDDDRWERLRRVADAALFTGYADRIRFAALTIDGVGLPHYGECSLTLREDMIAHRASIYEDNSTVFVEIHGPDVAEEPGHRAQWGDRSIFAVAKLAAKLGSATKADEFPRILLSPGPKPEDDRFIEVNVYGPMTIRTFSRVVVTRKGRLPDTALLRMVREKLKKRGVPMEVR